MAPEVEAGTITEAELDGADRPPARAPRGGEDPPRRRLPPAREARAARRARSRGGSRARRRSGDPALTCRDRAPALAGEAHAAGGAHALPVRGRGDGERRVDAALELAAHAELQRPRPARAGRRERARTGFARAASASPTRAGGGAAHRDRGPRRTLPRQRDSATRSLRRGPSRACGEGGGGVPLPLDAVGGAGPQSGSWPPGITSGRATDAHAARSASVGDVDPVRLLPGERVAVGRPRRVAHIAVEPGHHAARVGRGAS